MYVPTAFAETDLPTLHDFIEQNSFGLLVSQVHGEPFATHLPFLLDRQAGPRGTLICHVARANPQWRHFAEQTILAVFSGPHAYISPTWYEAEGTVPTWNYTAAHVYGRVELVEDEAGLLDIVAKSTREFERTMPRPWLFDESAPFVKGLLRQFVGLRIEIGKIEGKWKLNQNHPEERRAKVIVALQERGHENALGVARLMQGTASTE